MASLMSQQELDPVFVKALKLLQSKREDSAKQLRAMLDDAIRQRRGVSKPDKEISGEKMKSDGIKLGDKLDPDKKEAEKRSIDKLKKDISDLSGESAAKKPKLTTTPPTSTSPALLKKSRVDSPNSSTSLSKKSRVDSPNTACFSSSKMDKDRETETSKTKMKDVEKSHKEKIEKGSKGKDDDDNDSTESEESGMDADDFAFDMGISCIVCRQFDLTSKNQLVECLECHNLYHQECHRPPITEDVNDPRFVWYCSRCAKNLKKMVTAKPPKPKPLAPVVSKDSSVKPKETTSTMTAFKRMEPLKPSSKEHSQAPKALGWAALAKLADGKNPKSDSKSTKPDAKLSSQSKSLSSKSVSSNKLSSSGGLSKSSGSGQSGTDSSSSSIDKKFHSSKKKSSKSHEKKK